MTMRIVIGSLQCEGNSLTPLRSRFKDFDYVPGEAMFQKVVVTDFFRERGCSLVPTIYARALPGGAVAYEDYMRLAKELVDAIPEDGIDGIWLYLHGAMCVEGIGSGETYLLKMIRDKVGNNIPISLALDFHANNTDELMGLANCITGYRTAPHRDREETQIRAAELLLKCLEKKILPSPQIARANVVPCGDSVQTDIEPLKSIMKMARDMEQNIPGLLSVEVFNGHPWIDEPYMGPNFVVTHEYDTTKALECATCLAEEYYARRHEFQFLIEAVEPEEAIRLAMNAEEDTVFLSDSGDNTTAGATGDNAYMLNRLRKAGATNVLLAGIADKEACQACYRAALGEVLTLQVGGSLDTASEKAEITGTLIHKGDLMSYTYGPPIPSATIDCGGITVVITEKRTPLCRPDILESIHLDWKNFKIVVVKLGYLFPELAQVAPRSILAFTPGSSAERLEDMHMKHIRRPMFPLEDNFM